MSCSHEIRPILIEAEDSSSQRKTNRLMIFCNAECISASEAFLSKTCFKTLLGIIEDHSSVFTDILIQNGRQSVAINEDKTKVLKRFVKCHSEIADRVAQKSLTTPNCESKQKCLKGREFFLKFHFGHESEPGLFFENPLKALFGVSFEINKQEGFTIEADKKCIPCVRDYVKLLRDVEKLLQKSTLIQTYHDYYKRNAQLEFGGFLELYLRDLGKQDRAPSPTSTLEREVKDQYSTGPYRVSILGTPTSECLYELRDTLSIEHHRERLARMAEELRASACQKTVHYSLESFDQLLTNRMKEVQSFFIEHDLLPHERGEEFQQLFCFESLGLGKFLPLFMDEQIEEIYYDGPGTVLYLDHEKWGRCKTNLFLEPEELKNFKTKLRTESNLPLNEETPSLKTDILTQHFQVRVEMNINPLAADGINFVIRKLRRKVFSITELLNLNTLTVEALALLYFFLSSRRSIIIIGEPGSGKTTLLNALDLLAPDEWRKVYIEDVVESVPQLELGKHQMRFRLSPKGGDVTRETKSFQVRETLHRTPDLVIIGELIHRETIHAFFFLLKVGLQCCLGTCHGTNSKLIIERWMEDEGISKTSIGNIDIMVQMGKTKFGRRVIRIDEVVKQEGDGRIEIKSLFHRDPANDTLLMNLKPWEELYRKSSTIKKIEHSLIESLTNERFKEEIDRLKEIFNYLMNNKVADLKGINERMRA